MLLKRYENKEWEVLPLLLFRRHPTGEKGRERMVNGAWFSLLKNYQSYLEYFSSALLACMLSGTSHSLLLIVLHLFMCL